MVNITNVAEIFTGYTIRADVTLKDSGEIAVLQLKDLTDDYVRFLPSSSFTDGLVSHERHLLRPNDLIFVAKGMHNHAVLFEPKYPRTIASSTFFVVRPDLTKVDPHFLWWYLNEPAQAFFRVSRQGSTTLAINMSTFLDLKLPLLPMDTQRKIGQISRLSHQYQQLSIHLLNRQKQLTDHILNQLIQPFTHV